MYVYTYIYIYTYVYTYIYIIYVYIYIYIEREICSSTCLQTPRLAFLRGQLESMSRPFVECVVFKLCVHWCQTMCCKVECLVVCLCVLPDMMT